MQCSVAANAWGGKSRPSDFTLMDVEQREPAADLLSQLKQTLGG